MGYNRGLLTIIRFLLPPVRKVVLQVASIILPLRLHPARTAIPAPHYALIIPSPREPSVELAPLKILLLIPVSVKTKDNPSGISSLLDVTALWDL